MRTQLWRGAHGRCAEAAGSEDCPRMDEVDLAILNELQEDGHLSLVELGQRVGLSAAPVQRRLRGLEREGWITAYVALVDPHRARLAFETFVEIEVEYESPPALLAFEDRVQELREVTECYRIAGDAHYLLKVVTRDATQFATFYLEHLLTLPGMARTKRRVSLSRVKHSTALPLPRSARDLGS
jgi:Lrp/AsnC family transcriptional regulator, leucine-responsive regulatory protein